MRRQHGSICGAVQKVKIIRRFVFWQFVFLKKKFAMKTSAAKIFVKCNFTLDTAIFYMLHCSYASCIIFDRFTKY